LTEKNLASLADFRGHLVRSITIRSMGAPMQHLP